MCLLVSERNLCYQEPYTHTKFSKIIGKLWNKIEESKIQLVMDLQRWESSGLVGAMVVNSEKCEEYWQWKKEESIFRDIADYPQKLAIG